MCTITWPFFWYISVNRFEAASNSTLIWYLSCYSSSYTSITQCSKSSTYSCTHKQDVALLCSGGRSVCTCSSHLLLKLLTYHLLVVSLSIYGYCRCPLKEICRPQDMYNCPKWQTYKCLKQSMKAKVYVFISHTYWLHPRTIKLMTNRWCPEAFEKLLLLLIKFIWSSGGLPQWPVGNCVWLPIRSNWCWCGV